MHTPEISFWQYALNLRTPPDVAFAPDELARIMTALEGELLPEGENGTQWQFPAFQGGGGMQFAFGPAGAQALAPDIVTGQNERGWLLKLAPQKLILRQSQTLRTVAPEVGGRAVDAQHFVSENDFLVVARRVTELIPPRLRQYLVRMEMAAEYVSSSGNTDPGTWIAQHFGRGRESQIPLADGVHALTHYGYREFERVCDHRQVWTGTVRVGNWFDDSGAIKNESAVVFFAQLMTAFPEVGLVSPMELMNLVPPFINWDQAESYLSMGPEMPLQRVLQRVRRDFPAGV